VFFLTQALAPLIADGGRIVNFSSQLTRTSFPGAGWLNGRRIEAVGGVQL
jgi:NAD(P)-dependent dehydrogenase (short-subunit alcohol dehydrogenase family)